MLWTSTTMLSSGEQRLHRLCYAGLFAEEGAMPS